VDELHEVPEGRPVVFSAHGVPKQVPAEADRRGLFYLDATCPLVSKVHREVERHFEEGKRIVLIGHAGHPEVVGTMGQLPDGAVVLVETEADVARLDLVDTGDLAYATQTTLSIDETAGIVAALQARFPSIAGPKKEDICYATTNRQQAVKSIAHRIEALLVLGAPNSSNSKRLVEVAKTSGCGRAWLVQRAAEIDWAWLEGVRTLGITAGASAPEVLVEEVVDAIRSRFDVTLETVTTAQESIVFKLPKALVEAEGPAVTA
jgi:4-hydroxy-3-methylbut-2-enyl diphosphate reductase